jgi:hypothetical protein
LLFPEDMTCGLGREEGIKSFEKQAKWTMKKTWYWVRGSSKGLLFARRYKFCIEWFRFIRIKWSGVVLKSVASWETFQIGFFCLIFNYVPYN